MENERYHLGELVASGGMGSVYRGELRASNPDGFWLQREVAIKIVREDLARNPDFSKLFMDEARLALNLSHGNIVQCHDVTYLQGRPALVMEWVDGANLGNLLATAGSTAFSIESCLFIVTELLKGLDYAHRRCDRRGEPLNLVHRDISPTNILLSREGEVKIADFGVAKSRLKQMHSLDGSVKGKVPYASPEQLKGDDVDNRADLYATGTLLYEMLAGRRMIGGQSVLEAMHRIVTHRITPLNSIRSDIDAELVAIVTQATHPQRQDRFATAAAMHTALLRYASQHYLVLSPSSVSALVQRYQAKQHQAWRELGASLAQAVGEHPTSLTQPTASPMVSSPGLPAEELVGPPTGQIDKPGWQADRVPLPQTRLISGPFAALQAPLTGDPRATSSDQRRSRASAIRSVQSGWRLLSGFRGKRRRLPVIGAIFLAMSLASGVLAKQALDPAAGESKIPKAAVPGSAPQKVADRRQAQRQPQAQQSQQQQGQDKQATVDQHSTQTEATVPAVAAATNTGRRSAAAGSTAEELIATTAAEVTPPRGDPARNPSKPSSQPTADVGSRPADDPFGSATHESPQPRVAAAPLEAEAAWLSINSNPWSYVSVNGKTLGSTPVLRHNMAAGTHTIVLSNPVANLQRTYQTTLAAGEHKRLSLRIDDP